MQISADGIVIRVEHGARDERQTGFVVTGKDLSLNRIASRLDRLRRHVLFGLPI